MKRRHALNLTLGKFLGRLWRLFKNPVFLLLTFLGNLLIVVGAVIVYILEKGVNARIQTPLDTLWWAVSTVTTVGYGDVTPITAPGRIIGIIMMIVGTALFCSFTALFAEAFLSEEISDFESELKSISRRVHEISQNENADIETLRRHLRVLENQIGSSSSSDQRG